MSLSQWKVTARAPLIFAHGQVSCIKKTIEHAHAQLTVVIVAPPEHAGQAASDADHVKVPKASPNTDFTTVLCRRMSSIGPPSFRESNRAARRHGGFMKPLDQLWKRLVALYKKLVYGVARVGRWDARFTAAQKSPKKVGLHTVFVVLDGAGGKAVHTVYII